MQCAIRNTQSGAEQDNFALSMRQAMLTEGISFKKLAKKLGCHRNSIRLAEHGLAPKVRAKIVRTLRLRA